MAAIILQEKDKKLSLTKQSDDRHRTYILCRSADTGNRAKAKRRTVLNRRRKIRHEKSRAFRDINLSICIVILNTYIYDQLDQLNTRKLGHERTVKFKISHFRHSIRRAISAGRQEESILAIGNRGKGREGEKGWDPKSGSFASLYGVPRAISGSQINPLRVRQSAVPRDIATCGVTETIKPVNHDGKRVGPGPVSSRTLPPSLSGNTDKS